MKTHTTKTDTSPKRNVSEKTYEVKRVARDAATSPWMTRFARLGYAIKGVVYLVIGVLAVQLAVGHGGRATDQKGALQAIASLPFGHVLLVIVTVGLLGFAVWCWIQAIFDTEGKGHDAKGVFSRLGYAIIGIGYASLAWGASKVVAGAGSAGKSSTEQTQDWTGRFLQYPLGVALVVVLGLVVLGIAGYLLYKAYSANFQSRLHVTGGGARMRTWLVFLGRVGYAALGIVFVIVGMFLIVAAMQHNPSKAEGLDSVLKTLAHQPFGSVLLALVALGLIAYGAYSFVEARYRRVGTG
jgi:hypothetical protein